eukprot:SAG22_NODE_1404_length_4491_cov_3.411885_6_plen_132_part_00
MMRSLKYLAGGGQRSRGSTTKSADDRGTTTTTRSGRTSKKPTSMDPKMSGKSHVAAMDMASVATLNAHLATLMHTTTTSEVDMIFEGNSEHGHDIITDGAEAMLGVGGAHHGVVGTPRPGPKGARARGAGS